MRLTLGQVKASRIGVSVGIDPNTQRFVDFVNEAQERLLNRGHWWGTQARYRFCVDSACITWPRQIAAIDAVAVDSCPVTIRNGWHEFLENGPGLQTGDACSLQMYDRGTAVTFNDIAGINKKIRVYADVTEADGAKILLLGYDENGNWIRTLVGGEYVDGEYLTLSTTPQLSTKLFTNLTGVQKPVTRGTIRLYEYDTDITTQRPIAYYEPDEMYPNYRRSLISGLDNHCSPCGNKTVTVVATHAFIPVRLNTDYLVIGCMPALKDMVSAVKLREDKNFDEAEKYEASAIRELEKELRHFTGSGTVVTMRSPPRNIYGGGVENMI